jgi:hypothetical protein
VFIFLYNLERREFSVLQFLTLYSGALYAFAVQVAPGTVLDPAGLPAEEVVLLVVE